MHVVKRTLKMKLRALLVLFLLSAAVYPPAVVATGDDTKHDVGNQVEAHDAKDELEKRVQGGCSGLDEDESKYGGGLGQTLQRGGGDTERGGGGGDSSRGGGGGDSSRRGRGGDRECRGGRGRGGRGRGGRGGRGGGV